MARPLLNPCDSAVACRAAAAARRSLRVLGWLLTWAPVAVHAQHGMLDDLHREVHFAQPPQRVITLLPSLTEIVCALDECARLVATDRYSNWPPSVALLPKAGGLDDAQVERIVALHPDVVLLSRSARVTERLAELGVRTFAVRTDTFEDLAHSVRVVAEVLGVGDRAAALNAQIESGISALERRARQRRAPAPSVYFEVDSGPYAAGAASYIGQLLLRLGARNIVPAALGPFPKLNPEYVVRYNPDVIVAPSSALAELPQRPGWASIRAVREHRLCTLDAQTWDAVMRPGPRVVQGLQALDACLQKVAP